MLVVAAALVAAAPAHAQRPAWPTAWPPSSSSRQPQANRTCEPDQPAAQQVQDLQGTVEQLQHDNAQLKQSGRINTSIWMAA
jgi:hypothetical protein